MSELLARPLFADELVVSEEEITKVLEANEPGLATLQLMPIGAGTDNRVFRLGERLSLRIPRTSDASSRLRKGIRWMPYVTRDLPLQSPKVVYELSPAGGREYRWAVYEWVAGRPASEVENFDTCDNAIRLAE